MVLTAAGAHINEPVNTLMALLLPVLVAFGIINDPTVRGRLFGDGDQVWYRSWAVWLAMAALITYCVRLFFKLDVGPVVDGMMNVLLPVLMALGIVNNPTVKNSL